MALILHPATGFPVGDPRICPLDPASLPSDSEMEAALGPLILSASGWRKVFAADGDEDSRSPGVSPADLCLAALMARVFALRLAEAVPPGQIPCVALGIDSRPTGPALADIMTRVFLASGVETRYSFIIAAPEIMARTRSEVSGLTGFCYISASHNPPGHNGVKFGFADGGVLPVSEAGALAEGFLALARNPRERRSVLDAAASADWRTVSRVFTSCAAEKRAAVSAYVLFTRRTVTDREDLEEQERELELVSDALESRPLGVVAEMNGSARSLSIDGDFLTIMGVKTRLVNAQSSRLRPPHRAGGFFPGPLPGRTGDGARRGPGFHPGLCPGLRR